jgi:hypothetical protein
MINVSSEEISFEVEERGNKEEVNERLEDVERLEVDERLEDEERLEDDKEESEDEDGEREVKDVIMESRRLARSLCGGLLH